MPRSRQTLLDDLQARIRDLAQHAYTPIAPLHIQAWCSPEPLPFARRHEGQHRTLQPGQPWGDLFHCAWFHLRSPRLPDNIATADLVFLVDLGGEGLVVDDEGAAVRGLTNVDSEFDRTLGEPGKRVIPLAETTRVDDHAEVWIDAGANDLFGLLQHRGHIQTASLAHVHPTRLALHHDLVILLDLLHTLPENTPHARSILHTLDHADRTLRAGYDPDTLEQARNQVAAELTRRTSPDHPLTIHAIGHAHLDLAWLWPLRETRRKIARTLATTLRNLERDPDITFGLSQPLLLDWLADDHPALSRAVRQRIDEGRIEPLGCMLVEPDANLLCGESLTRQITLGLLTHQRYTHTPPDHAFLPDTFGFNAALPQLLAHAGIRAIILQKLSWNLHNPFPFHSFRWRGVDGTAIPTHLLPEHTYNSPALPHSLHTIARNDESAHLSSHALMVYGIGDGGGGPGHEHVARLQRLQRLHPLPPTRHSTVAAFLDVWLPHAQTFPVYDGELYLERHQGTFTTNARLKAANRRVERRLLELEWLSVATHAPTPHHDLWRDALLLQFHDILPGSSIARVTREALDLYEDIERNLDTRIASHIQALSPTGPHLLNPTPCPQSTWVAHHGDWHHLDLPPLSLTPLSHASRSTPTPPRATTSHIEHEGLELTLSPLPSSLVYEGRELLSGPVELHLYPDPGDAWDMPDDLLEGPQLPLTLDGPARCVTEGPAAHVTQRFRGDGMEIALELRVESGSPAVHLELQVRLERPHTQLRLRVPTTLRTGRATFEIPFGHIERPQHPRTADDRARVDTPALRWASLDDGRLGLAVLNTAQHGYRTADGVIDVALLRSVPIPNEEDTVSDLGSHTLRLALLPFRADPAFAAVRDAAHALHQPPRLLNPDGALPELAEAPWSLARVEGDAALRLSAIKPADDGSGDVVCRLFCSAPHPVKGGLELGFDVIEATRCDLCERPLDALEVQGSRRLEAELGPFEVWTCRVRRG